MRQSSVIPAQAGIQFAQTLPSLNLCGIAPGFPFRGNDDAFIEFNFFSKPTADTLMKTNTHAIASALALLVAPLTQASAAQASAAQENTATSTSVESAVLARLNELEARVKTLEARNAELESQAEQTTSRVERVELRSAKAAQPGPVPTYADVNDNFTFKPRGTLQADVAFYNERAGGYDYNNGTDIRRARLGFDGTAYRDFKWRAEAEYVKNTANLLDLYVTYAFTPDWSTTVGQQKTPYGLGANSFDGFNTFLERGMASTAFGAVGAERRVGLSVAYKNQTDQLNGALGLFGVGEAVGRNATTPDEGYGFNGRLTWDPILNPGDTLHLGVSAYYATDFASNSVTLADRPNIRVDDGRLLSVAITGTAPPNAPETGARSVSFYGAEALWIRGAFSVQSEYGALSVARFGASPSTDFDGGYIFGSWFATGETRVVRNGTIDRVRPFNNFEPAQDNWGAFEFALRYDTLDLTDLGLSPLNRKARNWTAAANWYLNPNTKLIFNYIRFHGSNSPLVVAPVAINGTIAKGDAIAARVQFDF